MTSSRTAIIAGNWKMHYGPKDASDFAMELVPKLGPIMRQTPRLLCILCPPAISLSAVREIIDSMPSPRLELGAQNMYFEEKGAFTGETSPPMLHELCSTVILGHSERRIYFGETDELVNKKTLAALKYGLRPIVCIGENEIQHQAGQTEQVICVQVQGSLANLPAQHVKDVVIAYEPIWAIGTGKAATAEGAGNVAKLIRQLYCSMYGDEAGNAVRILYGGSVTSNNCYGFISHTEIDGALVGGASIKLDFAEIVRKTGEMIQQ